jgi:hypothetical protein
MRRGSIITMALGAAGATAALIASPGTYEWLRRVTGRGSDRHHYETELAVEDLDDLGVGDEASVETDDLRLSLRARLAESAGDVGAVNAEASESEGVAEEVDEVAASRARVRAKAREARARIAGENGSESADE